MDTFGARRSNDSRDVKKPLSPVERPQSGYVVVPVDERPRAWQNRTPQQILKGRLMPTLAACLCAGLFLAALFLVYGPFSFSGLRPGASAPDAALPNPPPDPVDAVEPNTPPPDTDTPPPADRTPPDTGATAPPDPADLIGPGDRAIPASPPDSPDALLAPAGTLAAPGSAGFLVQLGAFRDPSNADRLADSIRAYSSDLNVSVEAGSLHTVTIGPFQQRTAAERTAQTLGDALGLSPLVIRRGPE